MIKNIAVIGAGTMGNGIAHVFAQYGFNVNIIDVSQDRLDFAVDTIKKNFERQVNKKLITEELKNVSLKNITAFTSLSDGVKIAELVVEAATENAELKQNIFQQLDELTSSECILATNTSSISITKIASVTKRPEKVIGMHFMNPVPVMKLVEVIAGYSTDKNVTDEVLQLVKAIEKIACVVNDYPGFIANRILMPMINEAAYSLYENIAGVTEIDSIMKLGMAHPMGPLQLADFIGLDVCHSILNVMYEGFRNPKYAPCPLLTNMVNAKYLGIKTGEGFYKYFEGSKELKVSERFLK